MTKHAHMQRLAALMVLILGLGLPLPLGFAVVHGMGADVRASHLRVEREHRGLDRLIASAPELEARAQALADRLVELQLFHAAQRTERARTAIQSTVSQIVSDGGGQISRMEVKSEDGQGPVRALTLDITFTAKESDALAILDKIERARPLLSIARAVLSVKQRAGTGAAMRQLEVDLTVSGFQRPAQVSGAGQGS